MANHPLFTLYRDAAHTWLDHVYSCQTKYLDHLTNCQTAYFDCLRTLIGQQSSSPISGPVTEPGATTPVLKFSIDQLCENSDPASLPIASPSQARRYVVTPLTAASSGEVIPAENVKLTLRSKSPQTLLVALADLQPLLNPDPLLAANASALTPGTYSGQILDGQVAIATIDVVLTTVQC